MSNEALQAAAEGIKDKKLRSNALALLDKMTESIAGIGDREIAWRPSTLKVVQSMSDPDSLPDGAKAGSMVLGDDLLSKEHSVIPLRVWDSRLMWHPNKDVNEIVCQSPDGKTGYKYGKCSSCEHSQFVEGQGAACNKTKNVMVVSADLSDVFVCVFAKSQFAMGKEWETTMKKAKTHPYKRVYSLGTSSHPKYKKVQVLNAHVESSDLPDDVLDFLQALFSKISDDRMESLDRFYESVERRASNALEDKSGGDVKRIEVQADDDGEVIIEGQEDGREYEM